MSNYLHPTRFEPSRSLQANRIAWPAPGHSFDLRQLATSAVAFLIAVAVVIDTYWFISLLGILVTSEESWTWATLIQRCPFGELVSTPLYVLASLIGIGLTATQQTADRWLLLGWFSGLIVSSIELSQTLLLNPSLPVPSWGLLSFWFAILCLQTIDPKSNPFSVKHVAFFVSILFCLSLWGKHGNLGILQSVFTHWQGLDVGHPVAQAPASTSISWQDATLAFVGGFLAVVVLPCLFIRIMFRDSARSFGLSIPSDKRGELWFRSGLLLLAGFPIFYFSSTNPELQSHYPYVRDFAGPTQLVLFEISTLLFYACVEFIFRGYILFGVEKLLKGNEPSRSNRIATAIAIVVSAIPYIIWHLEKPAPELVGALFWAIIAGVSAIQYRTVIHLIVIHWLWNVCLDVNVLRHLEIGFTG